ncbi:MAG: NUDIX domain-containing protein [Bacteroidia bacterium]
MKNKVYAYVTRMADGNRQILVYSHQNNSHAGVQIPGGTVEPGERIEETLYRELEEESGLVHLRFIGKLAQTVNRKNPRRELHHFFLVESLESPPDTWTHEVQSFGKDDGHIFDFFWVDLREAKKLLPDEQRKFVNLITTNYPDDDPANHHAVIAGTRSHDVPFIGSESRSRLAE